jgi:hypothetical protein
MSLERVIAEQMQTIDGLRSRAEHDRRQIGAMYEAEREVGRALFDVLYRRPNESTARQRMREVLLKQGWCFRCESRPCACMGYDE